MSEKQKKKGRGRPPLIYGERPFFGAIYELLPSNRTRIRESELKTLAKEKHGISSKTLHRHLIGLREVGLVVREDKLDTGETGVWYRRGIDLLSPWEDQLFMRSQAGISHMTSLAFHIEDPKRRKQFLQTLMKAQLSLMTMLVGGILWKCTCYRHHETAEEYAAIAVEALLKPWVKRLGELCYGGKFYEKEMILNGVNSFHKIFYDTMGDLGKMIRKTGLEEKE